MQNPMPTKAKLLVMSRNSLNPSSTQKVQESANAYSLHAFISSLMQDFCRNYLETPPREKNYHYLIIITSNTPNMMLI